MVIYSKFEMYVAEVGHMILESNQFTKILASLADYSIEVVHNLVGVLGHLSANG